MPHRIAKQIHTRILSAEHIILVPHQNPDGDTLGSVAAMMQWLRRIDISHTAFCATDISPKLRFLPHIDYISKDPSIWKKSATDLVIVFDSGDLNYAGVDTHVDGMAKKPDIINIDHHATNTNFGTLNLVMEKASSTTMILYKFFAANNIKIDTYMATCLLTGLITDTGNFTNAATTTGSLKIASKLVELGGDLTGIQNATMKDQSVKGLKLWGKILERLTHHEALDIVHTHVTQQDLREHDIDESKVEGVANFMNNITDGRAGMILKERNDGTVKGSFRTTRDDVDVSAFAKLFGGGGHKKAAGFTVEHPIEQAAEYIFSKILEFERLTPVPVRIED